MNTMRLRSRLRTRVVGWVVGCVLVAMALPALASLGVGLVTRVSGGADVTFSDAKASVPARDFVTVKTGDRYSLKGDASVEIVFFPSARRELWQGPVEFTITDKGGHGSAGVTPKVTPLPPAAVKALRKMPLRKTSSTSRPGAFRIRGNEEAKAVDADYDAEASRRHADALLALEVGEGKKKSLKWKPLRLALLDMGELTDGLAKTAREMGFEVLPAGKKKGADVTLHFVGAYNLDIKGGPLWQIASNVASELPGALLAAARVSRVLQLNASKKGKTAGRVGLKMVPTGGKPARRLTVKSGDELTFETSSKSRQHLFYAIVEVGPSESTGIVYPTTSAPAILKPGERRRLALRFNANPPLGPYQYVMLATLMPEPWWHRAKTAEPLSGMPEVLHHILHGPRPAAAMDASVGAWTSAMGYLNIDLACGH